MSTKNLNNTTTTQQVELEAAGSSRTNERTTMNSFKGTVDLPKFLEKNSDSLPECDHVRAEVKLAPTREGDSVRSELRAQIKQKLSSKKAGSKAGC